MFVKICGIRSLKELEMIERFANDTGVVVECESKRRIPIKEAKELIEEAEIPVFVVSTLESFEGWSYVIEKTEASYVQIHTDKVNPKDVERIKSEFDVFIMKAFKVPERSENPEEDASKLIEDIDSFDVDMVLLDTGKGTGITHDHRVSRIVAAQYDIVLAGGLNSKNVAEIVEFVKPFGVDVSSGVEKNGRKDEKLIREFLSRVKNYGNKM